MLSITNIPDLDPSLRNYLHEESDTGMVLNALDVSKRDPFTDLVISCSDTDVLLILIHYYEQLTSSIVFKTTVHSYFVREIYENLSPSIRHTLRISHLYWMRSNRKIFWFWKTIVLDHNEFFKESFRRIPRTRFAWWSQQLTPWCFRTFCGAVILPKQDTPYSSKSVCTCFLKGRQNQHLYHLLRKLCVRKSFALITQLLRGKRFIFHIKIYLILKIVSGSGRALHLGMKRWQHCSHLLLKALYI